jgi:hypothetical protein
LNDVFGNSVAMDGDTIVVGDVTANVGQNSEEGAAYVFVKPASGWHNMTQTAKLTASDGEESDGFGQGVHFPRTRERLEEHFTVSGEAYSVQRANQRYFRHRFSQWQ